ncbi:hemerythrin [Novosphingobium endophyticum]|uniref:Hemerythrin n=1 Tax=Novosphingobium endophyticum TaxID=1955250 RepID=A0A916TQL8_9SPHN|nr:hemerythrin domain-containing protein [Novosphingobium endophyticum]GGB95469.1 hemerythrin [Novosphingobium endophyticum]
MTKARDTDATHILAQDHRKVEDLFEKYSKTSGRDAKAKLAKDICKELNIHTMIEEEIFYPALRGKIEEDMLNEAYVEHDGAKVLINEIAGDDQNEEFYDAKVHVLKEQIEHHVGEEEKQQGNMFQQARAADVDLDALGEQMLARKEELKQQAETQGLPEAKTTTM